MSTNDAKRTVACISPPIIDNLAITSHTPPTIAKKKQRRCIRRKVSIEEPSSRPIVAFSPTVNTRCYFQDEQQQQSSTWSDKDEIDNIKAFAKTSAKMHRLIRSKLSATTSSSSCDDDSSSMSSSSSYPSSASFSSSPSSSSTSCSSTSSSSSSPLSAAAAAAAQATHYMINSESLRGKEHITDIAHGRNRRSIKVEAITAVIVELQDQYVNQQQPLLELQDHNYVNQQSSSLDQSILRSHDKQNDAAYYYYQNRHSISSSMKIDTHKLSNVYGTICSRSLEYAKAFAREDAKVAASILADDLKD